MTGSKRISLTTTLPYVNADPHIGFALEIVHADIIARYYRLMGYEVFFNTGTDEHGQKIFQKAEEAGKDPQSYVDEYAARFDKLKGALNLTYNNFIRTTDPHHKAAAQEFWKRCLANGDIYKKNYEVKYCVGCELEKTDSELNESGHCLLHPNLEIEIRNEENYFFKFSNYGDKLIALYDSRPDFVIPDYRLNEIRSLITEKGLEDFSISRLKAKMSWGVPVPDDDEHVMYVWFDALVNYISALGWPDEKYTEWWPSIQFAGKDNLRQQSAMWQAMLMSAGVEPSKNIIIHGFITSGGQKMSKSLGNVINPFDVVDEYGTEALRYYLARHVHPFEDSDFTMERFKETYNAGLANGLGNLVARVMKMAEDHLDGPAATIEPAGGIFGEAIESFNIQRAMEIVEAEIAKLDLQIAEQKPFSLIKTDPGAAKKIISELAVRLAGVAYMLKPILPETSDKILEAIKANKKPENLFARKD